MYNYREVVKEDVKNWMKENLRPGMRMDEQYDSCYVYDECWTADEVTGNGSGSYTFNRMEARKNFCEDVNSDEYLEHMVQDGFTTSEEIGNHIVASDWEWIDVVIRCFLLSEVVDEVIEEMEC